MVLQDDSLDLRNWVFGAAHPQSGAGSFVRTFAEACMRADGDNYDLLRPSLILISRKYPQYGAWGAVDKRERDGLPSAADLDATEADRRRGGA